MSIALALFFGVIIGLALGLTGGGGSVFAIPLLVFGLGMKMHEAVTLSLAAVALVALIGALNAAKNQLVEFRAGGILAVAGMIAAPAGVLLANRLDETTLLIAFGLLVIIVALVMWLKAGGDSGVVRADFIGSNPEAGGAVCQFDPENPGLRLTAPCSMVLAVTGIVTGTLSGLFGVGGGFVIVPALTFVTQLTIHRAVATSLLVIALIGGSGVISAIIAGRQIPLPLAAVFIAGGIIGLFAGQRLARRLAGATLQKAFAAAILLLGLVTIGTRL